MILLALFWFQDLPTEIEVKFYQVFESDKMHIMDVCARIKKVLIFMEMVQLCIKLANDNLVQACLIELLL